MGTLLERARSLMSGKAAVVGALVIVPLATAARKADALAAVNPYGFSGGSVIVHSTSSGDFAHPGTLGAVAGNPLRLNSSAPISVTASEYSTGGSGTTFRLTWQGLMDSVTYFPVNKSAITVHYDFIIGLAGTNKGSVNWALTDIIGGDTLNASSSSALTAASTEVTGTFLLPVTSALTNSWTTRLDLTWSGYTGDGVMTIDVPSSSSIDLGVVPEPASLAILGLGAVGLMVRRRRREGEHYCTILVGGGLLILGRRRG